MKTKISVSLPFYPKDIHVMVDLIDTIFHTEQYPDFEIVFGEDNGEAVVIFTSFETGLTPLHLTNGHHPYKRYSIDFNKNELYNDLMDVLGKGAIPS